jgi:putative ABC transport system permease protein
MSDLTKAPGGHAPFSLALSIARRELRGGLNGFRVFLACLILGVAAIAGIGSLTESLSQGLAAEGQALLGGDVEISTFRREATPGEQAWFEAHGELARALRLRGMTRADNSGERTLSEIKAVDGLYPLYGDLVVAPPLASQDLFRNVDGVWGVAIPANLSDRLRASLGDRLTIGDASFEVRAILESEPDRANEGLQWGPTVLMSWDAIDAMNLVRLGSLYSYHYKLRLGPEEPVEPVLKALEETFPQADWRVRDRENSAPGVRRFVDRMGMFLVLVGLSALAVGGVGVGNAVGNYLDGKTGTIATLKILGATSGLVFRVYLIQVMALAIVAVLVGLIVGSVMPLALGSMLPGDIPVAAEMGLYPAALLTAAVYGILITLVFAVWPLAKARDISAAELFRTMVSPSNRWPRKRYIFVVALASITIVAIAVGFSSVRALAAGFVAGAFVAFILLRFLGYLVQKIAANLPRPKKPGLRLALANMHRPGSATGAVVLSLGLGLTVFATITLVEGNLSQQVDANLPNEAPAFFMIDIQGFEIDAFRQTVEAIDGVNSIRVIPSLRGRVEQIDGVDVEDIEFGEGAPRWVINGDRNLTYAGTIPEGNAIADGAWWGEDYAGEPLISFAKAEADGLGIKVGTMLTMNVLGREIEARVANLRQFEWGSRGFNFVIVFAPGTLESAPHHYMASLNVEPDKEADAHRIITDAFPNVTSIRVREILETINHMLNQIGTAVQAMAALAIMAGVLVLAGALAAGHKHRVYDAVIMKVLGAVRRDILKAYVIEYVALGLVTGVVAIGLGTLAGWVVITQVMDMEYAFLPVAMTQTVLASIFVTVSFGLIGTWQALGAKPVEVLRSN